MPRTNPSPTDQATFSPSFQAALASPPLERRSWQVTTVPGFVGLFLWVAFFDVLGVRTLPVGGLGWSVLGVTVAALLCYQLLYLVPATWGLQTRRPLMVLCSSTFGARGATWFGGFVTAVTQVVWFAVATAYSVELVLQGLVACRLLDPKFLKEIMIGGQVLPGPLFLIVSFCWAGWGALVGAYLVRVIGALMRVFPGFLALLLAAAAIGTLNGLPAFAATGTDPTTGASVFWGGPTACARMIQLIFGFFAAAGVASADWGAVNRDARDVRLGGWVGVAFSSWVVATLALLTVAGAVGLNAPPPPAPMVNPNATAFLYHQAVVNGIGGRLAGVMLISFGLASLAPTTYATTIFSARLVAFWPRVTRLGWALMGAAAGWLVIASGKALRLEAIFTIMGAVFAPWAGAMAADYRQCRGVWPGPRRGVNLAGVAAWLVGLAVGLLPLVVRPWWESRVQPAAVFAFVAAFLVYGALARLGAVPPALPMPDAQEPPADSGPLSERRNGPFDG